MVMFVCKDAQTVLNRTKFILKIKYVIKFIKFNSNHELSYKNKWIRFKKKIENNKCTIDKPVSKRKITIKIFTIIPSTIIARFSDWFWEAQLAMYVTRSHAEDTYRLCGNANHRRPHGWLATGFQLPPATFVIANAPNSTITEFKVRFLNSQEVSAIDRCVVSRVWSCVKHWRMNLKNCRWTWKLDEIGNVRFW